MGIEVEIINNSTDFLPVDELNPLRYSTTSLLLGYFKQQMPQIAKIH